MGNHTVPKPLVCILGDDSPETTEIRGLIHNHTNPYRTELYTTLPDMKRGLSAGTCMAAILDLDTVSLDNRTICTLTMAFPTVRFFCVSRNRLHPELKDAISHYLFACLTKPIDPDELHFFLKCVRDDPDRADDRHNAHKEGPS